jgi:hypothetical protein
VSEIADDLKVCRQVLEGIAKGLSKKTTRKSKG